MKLVLKHMEPETAKVFMHGNSTWCNWSVPDIKEACGNLFTPLSYCCVFTVRRNESAS